MTHLFFQLSQLNLVIEEFRCSGRKRLGKENPIMSEDRFISRLCYSENEDLELDDWALPDANLTKKMVAQIEYYLSDDNLAKDAFLMKHVRRNKMGYVNIKLLTSFKKMKHLTKDWRITAHALQHHSSKLELNEEGNKVRRKDPVPESLLVQAPSRQLLVWNLSDLSPGPAPLRSTMETAINILEPFGSICTVRVFRPGKELPPEVQRYSSRYPQLCSQESVLVEYDDLESAGRAYNQLFQSEDSVKVLLLGRTSKKKAESDSAKDKGAGQGVAIVNRRMNQLQYGGEDSSAYSSSESEVASCSPLHVPRPSPRSSPRVLRAPLPAAPRVHSPLLASEMWGSPDTSPETGRRGHKNGSDNGKGHGPWVQRRGRLGVKRVPLGESLPPGVIRFPYGPDGSRGFHGTVSGRRRLYTPVI